MANLPIGKQRYDAFQSKARSDSRGGLTFLASYTISKTLEQVSLLNPQDLILVESRGDSKLDQTARRPARHPAEVQYQRHLRTAVRPRPDAGVERADGWLDQIIGGWELNWNVTYMSGWAVNYPNAAQV